MRGPRASADRLLVGLVRIDNLLDPVLLIARQVEPSEHHRPERSHGAATSAGSTRSAASKPSAGAWATKPPRTALIRALRRAGLASRESRACQPHRYRCRTQAEYDAFAHAAHVSS